MSHTQQELARGYVEMLTMCCCFVLTGNKQIKVFTVSTDLPEEIFKELNLSGGGGKKGKKGKGKKKK